MADSSPGVIGAIIGLLCQGQHRLVHNLVVLNISTKREPTLWSTVAEILNGLLQLGSKRVVCPSTKEGMVKLPPGSGELQVNIEFINVNLSLSPLHNALQFLEASCIVFWCLMGIKFQGGSTSGAEDQQQIGWFGDWVMLDHLVII